MISATWIYVLVFMTGTPNTGFAPAVVWKTETLAKCEEQRKLVLDAFPAIRAAMESRVACVKHDQKNVEKYSY